MKLVIVVVFCIGVVLGGRLDPLFQMQSDIAQMWDRSDTNFMKCLEQNLSLQDCAASFKFIFDDYIVTPMWFLFIPNL
jgi:hypothetical protein